MTGTDSGDCDHTHHGHGHGHDKDHERTHHAPTKQSIALDLGRKSLESGDSIGAQRFLQQSLAEGETVDAHLLLAEAIWRGEESGREESLTHYEAAAALARTAGDEQQITMIALGHGYALIQLGQKERGCEVLNGAKKAAEESGNAQAAMFVQSLIDQAGGPAPQSEAEKLQDTWRTFASAAAAEKKLMLFLRGSPDAPACPKSLDSVTRLRTAGLRHIQYIDVTAKGDVVPQGLQSVSDSGDLAFPQLFIEGKEVVDWRELSSTDLREKILAVGVELGDPIEAQPCHGTAFTEGLQPWEVALVELVAAEGIGDWAAKLQKLIKKDPAATEVKDPAATEAKDPAAWNLPTDAEALEKAWNQLAPSVKAKLEDQPDMPCGHTCNTCPTKHDCHLHDAVDGKVKDIEDLA